MGRAPCCDKANVKKGPWSPEEDAKLKSYIDNNGTGGNWIALPHKIGLKRCGKSCRLRWLNYLRPNIKHGGFTEDEDKLICSLYVSIGSRWSVIAAQLPGRTDNDIKNYWNTRLKKKLLLLAPSKPISQPSSSSSNDHHHHHHFEAYFDDHQPVGPWAQQEQSAAFDDMLFPAGGYDQMMPQHEFGFGEITSEDASWTAMIDPNNYVVGDTSYSGLADDARKITQDCWMASLLMFDEPRLLGHSR